MKVVCCILLILISGCATVEKAGHDLMNKDRTENLQSPFFDVVKSRLQSASSYSSVGGKYLLEDIQEARGNDVYFTETARLNRYANSVMNRLLKSSGIKADIRVNIVSSVNFGAHAHKHGLVTVSARDILDLKSEDEFAALLAHEASHVLLGHNRFSLSGKIYEKAESAIDLYLLYNAKGHDFENYFKFKALQWMLKYMISSAWDRAEENEADALGVDLLAKAGYRIEGMLGMLKVVRNVEKSGLPMSHAMRATFIHQTSTSIQIDVDGILKEVVTRLENDLGKHHAETDKRMRLVKAYMKTYHKSEMKRRANTRTFVKVKQHYPSYLRCANKLERSLLTGAGDHSEHYARCSLAGSGGVDTYARKMMADYRVARGQPGKAAINLRRALKYKPTGAVYRQMAMLAFRPGDYKTSKNISEQYEKKFDRNDLLPVHMAAAKRLGEDITAEKVKCGFSFILESIAGQKNMCDQAATGSL